MVELGILFGLLAGAALFMIVILLRRGRSRTQNAEGLLIEQARRVQAGRDKGSFNALAVHNTTPTMTDEYRRS
ncbi:hypothetical protein [Streptomyces sp. VRA16 Mangrove soil]|uniref:hypothetical protein n=1 Tax=Streptomyces sp. VRA16 Mangrove soil TaxID=2817434 RepID=UPI001A9FF6B8|nr:hypothetical protein [Streptomyces sp. VRA16 Mangrove soil]MBO1337155.1 hypothetical protein [Streptomyces sp. VRA16 Mangrove soil]